MFDVMADWLTVPLLHQEAGKPPRRIGLAHPSIAPYGVFTCKDRKDILNSIQSEREWVKFCAQFLQQPERVSDSQLSSNVLRVQNRAVTDALVTAQFAQLEQAEAVALLTKADIAFAAVNDMAAAVRHHSMMLTGSICLQPNKMA